MLYKQNVIIKILFGKHRPCSSAPMGQNQGRSPNTDGALESDITDAVTQQTSSSKLKYNLS